MRAALDAAAAAAAMGEVPVGAVVVLDGRVIATAANAPRTRHDPTAHAEMLAIRAAAEAIGDDRLSNCGASDPTGGAVEHGPCLFAQPTVHHRPEIYPGIGEEEAARLLRDFFATRRGEGK
jgi:tRNA(Arg) A34 adenosine deaminase TadA